MDYNKLNTSEKAWFTLGRCFNYIPTQEQVNVLHRLDLFMGDSNTAVSKFKEEKFILLANEISRFTNITNTLVIAKDLFAQAKEEKIQNEKEKACYYFYWGADWEAMDINNVLTISEASKKWRKDTSTLRRVFDTGKKFENGIDCRKSEGTWLVRKRAMLREYGDPVGGNNGKA